VKLSYSAVWDDTAALLRAHGSLIAAIAGVFLFLPTLLLRVLTVEPAGLEGAQVDPIHAVAAFRSYLFANLPWLLLVRIVQAAGTLAILRLVLGPRGTSVGGAIGAAFRLLPSYFVAFLLISFAEGIGLFLLVLPWLYLMARFAPLAPVFAAEQRRNPFDAMARAWDLTRHRGWAIMGLILLVAIGGGVAMLVANGLVGVVFLLLGGKTLGPLLVEIVGAATGAAFATLLIVLDAAIYRAVAPQISAAIFE
jgi:hypothetical protein